jgi:hypothetical protein
MGISGSDKALMYALGGVLRGGAGRGGYVDGRVYIAMDGQHIGFGRGDQSIGVIIPSLEITDALDEVPNTCRYRVHGWVPPTHAEVVITLGSKNRLGRMFAGYATTRTQRYAGVPANVQADIAATDYTWLLDFTLATKHYASMNAAAIVKDLVATYAAGNGFTANSVATDLPAIDEITFTNEALTTALTRLARRSGAYWYVDYSKDIHFFISETTNGNPIDLTPTHRSLDDFEKEDMGTQVLTRVYVEGRGSGILGSVNAGDTKIPVQAVDMFTGDISSVFLKASFKGSEGGAQHLDFSGVIVGGGGTQVGPGATPSNGPGPLSLLVGGSVPVGAHGYAYTWTTAGGETKPSAVTAITVSGLLAAPPSAPAVSYYDTPVDPRPIYGCWNIGDYVEMALSYSAHPDGNWDKAYETPLSPLTGMTAIRATNHTYPNPPGSCAQGFYMPVPYVSNPSVKWIRVWHRVNGGPWYQWLSPQIANQPDKPGQPYSMYLYYPQSAVQTTTPATASPSVNTVKVEGIAVGPATVTGRKLYRTPANQGATLKLLATLADNTTTLFTDTASDAALGAAPPPGDTSGLVQPAGQIGPGSTSIVVASPAPFESAGGWAVIGNGEQVIRYTGISGGSLIGVPVSGRGSITATVLYNAMISAAPMVIGIPATGARSILRPLTEGDDLFTVVVLESPSVQANLADLLNVASGVREEWVQDRRLSIPEARARAATTLAMRPLVDSDVAYTCRDLRTASGKVITIDLPAPTNVQGSYKIQSVTIKNFRPHPTQYPTFVVRASSHHYSYEDLIRRMKVKE